MLNQNRFGIVVFSSVFIGAVLSEANTNLATASLREVTVRPLYYQDSKHPTGSMGITRIENQQRAYAEADWEENALRLAISENLPRGAGNMLRVAAWTAAVTAGRTEGSPLTGQSFLIDVKGMVDGPSAGALYTIGMLATLRGEALLPNVTMTGTILPGGALGVVGGVKQKLDAALKGGMRKVVLSEAQRVDLDADGGIVDIAGYAGKIGIEVAFAGSLQDAYHEMTGKTLARGGAAIRGDISLPASMMSTIRTRTQQRFSGVNKVISRLRETPEDDPLQKLPPLERDLLLQVLAEAFDKIEVSRLRSFALMQEGEWVAAYDVLGTAMLEAHAIISWRDAGFQVASDEQLATMIEKSMVGNMDHRQKAVEVAGRLPVDSALFSARSTRDLLDLTVPLYIADTLDNLLAAHSEDLINRQKGTPDVVPAASEEEELRSSQLNAQISNTMLAYRYQASQAIIARGNPLTEMPDPDMLAGSLVFRGAGHEPPSLNLQKTREWAAFAESSYQAVNDALSEVLATENDDETWGRLLDPVGRRASALKEFLDVAPEEDVADAPAGDIADDAVPAEMTVSESFLQALIFTQEEVQMSAYLARHELGHCQSGVSSNPLLRGGSLRRLLDRAAENARQAILVAQSSGYEVIGPRYDYLLAQGLRYGDTEEQFKALGLYWTAAALCQLVDVCTRP